jgi:hypothetical protein
LAATKSKNESEPSQLKPALIMRSSNATEPVRPQPYQLKDLARAAGLSISGVRITYDQDEVREVTELTGIKPRREWTESG